MSPAYEFVAFQPWHVTALDVGDHDWAGLSCDAGTLTAMRQTGLCRTLIKREGPLDAETEQAPGTPVAILIGLKEWPGRVSVHLWRNERLSKREWLLIAAETRRGVRAALANGTHRVDCTVLADFPAALRFAERCGLQPEAVLERWGAGGEHHIICRAVRP